jgi:hypothetical protein
VVTSYTPGCGSTAAHHDEEAGEGRIVSTSLWTAPNDVRARGATRGVRISDPPRYTRTVRAVSGLAVIAAGCLAAPPSGTADGSGDMDGGTSDGAKGGGGSLRVVGTSSSGIAVPLAKLDEEAVALPPDVGRTDFTVEMWFKLDAGLALPASTCNNNPTNNFTGRFLIDRDMLGAGDNGDWTLTVFDGVIGFGAGLSTYGRAVCLSVAGWDPGEWMFVAGMLQHGDGGPNGNVRVVAYQPATDRTWEEISSPQDVPEASDFSYDESRLPETEPLNAEIRLGGTKWLTERSGQCQDVCSGMSGHIAEVRISTVLRHAIGSAPMPSAPFEVDDSTVALYHLDESDGQTAFDSAVVATDGQLVGDSRWSSDNPFE